MSINDPSNHNLDSALTQQPMSMLTINAKPQSDKNSPSSEADLLTIRFLEASERKMQLIKKLLNPEEYNSIATDLFTNDIEHLSKNVTRLKPGQTKPSTLYSFPLVHDNHEEQNKPLNGKLTRSETNIKVTTSADLQENLTKKREAIDFFFDAQNDLSTNRGENLAIELRSGYYLPSDLESEDKLVKNFQFNLFDRIVDFVGFVGIPLDTKSNNCADVDFLAQNKQFNCAPYTKGRNLNIMKSRLEADGQYNNLKAQQAPEVQGVNTKERELINLAELHQIHTLYPELDKTKKTKMLDVVGHFNRIRLEKSIKLDLIDSKISVDHPIVEYISGCASMRIELPRNPVNNNQVLNFGTMVLQIRSLKIIDHKLMSTEERISCKLLELGEKISNLRLALDRLTCKIIEIIDAYSSRNDDDSEAMHKKVQKLFELRIKLYEKVLIKQQELMALWNEIQAVRNDQEYNSTSIILTINPSSKKRKSHAIKDAIEKVMQSIDEKSTGSCRLLEYFKKLQISDKMNEIQELVVVKDGFDVTPDERCPRKEANRRRELSNLIDSIRVKLLIGQQHYYNCSKSRRMSNGLGLNLAENQFSIQLYDRFGAELEVQLHDSRYRLRTKLLAKTYLKIPVDHYKNHILEMKFIEDEDAKVELELSSKFEANESDRSRLGSDYQKLIVTMHGQCFNEKHPFEDVTTKQAKLLNRIDINLLMSYFTKAQTESYFALDPFVDQFFGQESTRAALLAWRWTSNLAQQVHLNERENIKTGSLQLEEFKSRLKSRSLKPELGYKSIEHIRADAIEHIRRCELQVEDLISFNSQKHMNQRTRIKDLLQEPRLRVDFSGVAKALHLLMPRRTARRPLMPKRHDRTAKSTASFSQEIDTSNEIDLESQALEQWHRHIQQKAGNLRLVVTIQHATNVPLRVVRSTQQQSVPALRPNSPFYSPSPTASFTGPIPSVQANYLAPPTTYVEVVFQRKQSASSLAQGKNPAWNETLFFPVDVSSLKTSRQQILAEKDEVNDSKLTGQLVDEYLQLNLYDCRCYLQSDGSDQERMGETQEAPTFTLASSQVPISPSISMIERDSTLQANRLFMMRQRIERHLIGSLRIPLTTLLSSGKIEGTFALNQPLLLDNYQFEPESMLANSRATFLSEMTNRSGTTEQNSQFETYISLFVTIDPPISIPLHIYLPTGSYETEHVFEYARLWEQVMTRYRRHALELRRQDVSLSSKLKKKHPRGGDRHVRALVLRDDARYCLACRYLIPMKPPRDLVEDKSDQTDQLNALARFVSLLSPLKYGLFNMRLLASSLWFNSLQLLEKCLGGHEEKAILLCNYFLHLGKCSALLLGDAIPAGRCIYVIVWHEQSRFIEDQLQLQVNDLLESIGQSQQTNLIRRPIDQSNFISRLPILISAKNVQLWDPNLGRCFSLGDQLPLIGVGSIVTLENVYANIQFNENPWDTNYDIRLKHFWFPLFEHNLTNAANQSANIHLDNSLNLDTRKILQASWRRQLAHLDSIRKSVGNPLIATVPRKIVDYNYNYEKFSPDQCDELRTAIERAIKSHLLAWRSNRPTYFNRTLSRLLADKLASFELQSNELDNSSVITQADDTADHKDVTKRSTSSNQQMVGWRTELADLIRNEVLKMASGGAFNDRQVISWPVNLPYTSMRTILDALFASGVHNADLVLDNSVTQGQSVPLSTQFLVACHVRAYPARVMSVWLYVGAVVAHSRSNLLN